MFRWLRLPSLIDIIDRLALSQSENPDAAPIRIPVEGKCNSPDRVQRF